jgi:hypothetical protein
MPNGFRRRNFFGTPMRTLWYTLIFTVFLYLGSAFYASYDLFGAAIGLYYAVGMAFQLGFNYDSEPENSQVFTT